MIFSERKELAKEFEVWRKENKVKNCAESVIAFLNILGLLIGRQEVELVYYRGVNDGINKCIELVENLTDKEAADASRN